MKRTMPLPPNSHRLRPDHLPTPFSAAQIRDGCPAGRFIVLREVEAGAPTSYRQIRFVAVDADGATQTFTPTDADGMPIGPSVERRTTWLELQGHLSFPADRATCDETTVDLAWGTEPGWLYVVHDGEEETRFWFAQRLPGMPVVVESWQGGRFTGRLEMVASSTARAG
jgi:hypothetical protein